jgi:CBS domain containing-hemolysin-like protein
VSAFLSGSETSLFSLSSLQLRSFKQSKNPKFQIVAQLMAHPREVMVTILMLNILANILVQNTVANLFDQYASWAIKVGLPLGLTLIFGDLLPKSIAMSNNTILSPKVAPIISAVAKGLGPIRRSLTRITSWLSRFFFIILRDDQEISPEELQHVLKTSEESGVLLKQERKLVGGALDLLQTKVLERMRPREEVLFYDMQDPLSELISLFVDKQITRIPVCDDGLENMKGILTTRQFFLNQHSVNKGEDLIPLLRKPYYVPETTKGWTLLKTMRERGESMAVVVDEYGSISGLITQEDLIEGVVGEISDSRDGRSLFTRSGDNVIIASGKLELADFAHIFGVELFSKENIVTLGGWLIEQMGTIPQTGATYATDEFLFYVLAADPNRIRRIYVRRVKRRKPE